MTAFTKLDNLFLMLFYTSYKIFKYTLNIGNMFLVS